MFNKLSTHLYGQPAPPSDESSGDGHGKLAALGALGAAAAGYLHGSGKPDTHSEDDSGHGTGSMAAFGAAAAYLYHKMHGDSDDGYASSEDDHDGALALVAGGAVVGAAALAFFYAMRRRKVRDYVVIVDASASMQSGVFNPLGGTRWSETQKALGTLTSRACELDPDGLSVYFFNDVVKKFDHIKTANDVANIFNTFHPAGFTDLAAALHAAFQEHFQKPKRRPTSILVIHDGEPNDEEAVKQALRNVTNSIKDKGELNVSFVQVGEDPKATAFLQKLDMGLGAKYDIVDTVNSSALQGQPFSRCIEAGLQGP